MTHPSDSPLDPDAMPADAAPADLSSDGSLSDAGAAAQATDGAGDASRLLDEQRDKYLRLAAEYDNYRKRAMRERQEAHARGQAELIKGILDALDDLGRFTTVEPAKTDARTLVEGVTMVEKKLRKSLAGHGLEIVDPTDAPFDPALHEAITTAPAASAAEDHMVAQVYQVGYVFQGQLVRPARVVVKQWQG